MNKTDTKQLMSEAKFYESYSRFIEDEERYETWQESVARVMDMHRQHYRSKMTFELLDLIQEAQDAYDDQLFLGAQRALQFGGSQLIKHQVRMYNCLKRNTRFVTKFGMRSFEDFNDGDATEVLTHTGSWKKAIVKCYGESQLNKITLKKGGVYKVVEATNNHRWLLKDSTISDSLKVGDSLLNAPDIFSEFNWDTASTPEKKYWCYGMVFGDGTINGNHSHIRLCGDDSKFKDRFIELGFKTSTTESLKGDFYAYTGTYDKNPPDPKVDSPELIRAFVAGYLQADGIKNSNIGGKQYVGIQATGEKSINFIKECFPIAGVHLLSGMDLTGEETNFGTRPYTIRFGSYEGARDIHDKRWKVISIEPSTIEAVWCLEVEDDKSFILESGVVTGNCVSSHANRAEFFGEFMYMLLCGAGAGASVQKHHVVKLPAITRRTKQSKTFVVPDSIEGWSTAVDILLSSFFIGGGKHPEYEGRKVHFDLSEIREKGAKISGGFKAPGHVPLRGCLDKIEKLLKKVLHDDNVKEVKLKPIEVYDICMYIADAVISGGIRRSATIFLFSKDDQEMMTAKTGNWFVTNPQRARSNNSVMLLRNETTMEEFTELLEFTKKFGEPGIIWTDNLEFTFNPLKLAA